MSKRISLFLPLLCLGALAACSDDAEPPPPEPQAVTAVTLESGPVMLTRELPGRTSPSRVAEVRPQVSGIVEERLFTEGGTVEAGQALYQLDDATYRADYRRAQASLARAQATLEAARLSATRADSLARVDAISEQEHENAIAALAEAEADIGVAEAAVASSEVTLRYARITSPISGHIGRSSVTQGALVTANQDAPLARVHQLDPIYVDLTQSSSEFLQLRKEVASGRLTPADDVPVTIVLEDGTPYEHEGKLAFAEVTVEPMTGSFALRVIVPNPDSILLPGMYVRALLSYGERQEGLLVPQQGITRDPRGNATAMVVADDGTVEQRTVQVRSTFGDQWLVDNGLAAGDRVIVEGLQKIQPGMPVEVTEAPPAAARTVGPRGGAAVPDAGRNDASVTGAPAQ